MRFDTNKAVVRLLPFISFLQRHICIIPFDYLFLVRDNRTELEGNAIATALHQIPIATHIIDWSNKEENGHKPTGHTQRPLYVSLVGESELLSEELHRPDTSRRHYKYIFVLDPRRTPDPALMEFRNAFYVLPASDHLSFGVWSFSDCSAARLHRFKSETSFIESMHWQMFLAQLVRLPAGVDLVVLGPVACPLNRCLVRFNKQEAITGVLAGLDNLIAKQVGARSHSYRLVDPVHGRLDKTFLSVRSVDARQTVDYVEANASFKHVWSVGLLGTGDWITSVLVEYVLLAPRRRNSTGVSAIWVSDIAKRCRIVAGILGIVFVLSVVRWVDRILVQSAAVDLGTIFFDTFSSVLAITPGRIRGSTTERLLLAFTAVLSIFASGLVSSALFEQILRPGQTDFYNSWQELVADKVDIMMPASLLGTSTETDLRPNQVFTSLANIEFHPGKAYVMTETQAIWFTKGNDAHKLLSEPYTTSPVALYLSHWYMEHPLQMSIQALGESGISAALSSAANHSARLWLERLPEEQTAPRPVGAGSLENWLLWVGWMAAAIVFATEMLTQRGQG